MKTTDYTHNFISRRISEVRDRNQVIAVFYGLGSCERAEIVCKMLNAGKLS